MNHPREENLYVQLIEKIVTAKSLYRCQQAEEADRMKAEAEDLRQHLKDMATMMEQAAAARSDGDREPMAQRAEKLRQLLMPEMILFQCAAFQLGAECAIQEAAITVH